MHIMVRWQHRLQDDRFLNQRAWAFLAGMAGALALPPVYALPLLAAGLISLLWLVEAQPTFWRSMGIGLFFGLGFHFAGLYWVSFSVLVVGDQLWMMLITGVGLISLMALFPALFAGLFFLFRPQGLWRPVMFATLWTACEFIRGHLLGGFPWNLFGYGWAFAPETLQSTAFIGIYGLTWLTVLLALSPATWEINRRVAAAFVVIPLALILLPMMRIPETSALTDRTVRLVQPSIPQDYKVHQMDLKESFYRHLKLSVTGHIRQPDLIIWPETAVLYWLEYEPRLHHLLDVLLQPGQIAIIGGRRGTFTEDGGLDRIWNSLFVIDDRGTIIDSYDKTRLVPFGEFIPLAGYLPLEQITRGKSYTAGTGVRTLHAGTLSFSPLICYEVIFPGNVVEKGQRPDVMINLTNDAWYGLSTGPFQHLAMTQVRAVEEGLPLLRAANSGISAIIDAHGRIRSNIQLNQVGVAEGYIPESLPEGTFFQKNPNLTLYLVVFLIFLYIMVWKPKRLDLFKKKT